MKLSAQQIAKVLVDGVADANDQEARDQIRDLVRFLAGNNMLGMWREIERAIHKIWKEKYGASQVSVTSAHSLSEQARQEIVQAAKGADMILNVDEKLIGGAIIRIDDTRIDGSVSGSLNQLKRALTA
ncbi:MAG: ATP synthase F1 subunit delta [bacterium]